MFDASQAGIDLRWSQARVDRPRSAGFQFRFHQDQGRDEIALRARLQTRASRLISVLLSDLPLRQGFVSVTKTFSSIVAQCFFRNPIR
ncbi:hypothetical protein ASF57_15970 [Methylobacterium sp. Leaf117]|nr:hypothetical protein ASF57_15970 [Methylobacterium sp. Leaf117]